MFIFNEGLNFTFRLFFSNKNGHRLMVDQSSSTRFVSIRIRLAVKKKEKLLLVKRDIC